MEAEATNAIIARYAYITPSCAQLFLSKLPKSVTANPARKVAIELMVSTDSNTGGSPSRLYKYFTIGCSSVSKSSLSFIFDSAAWIESFKSV